MAHGTPDWGVTAGRLTVYQLTDLAEAVARLGSIVTFDRRGDVIFLDDFESGIGRWTLNAGAPPSTFGLTTDNSRSGFFAARIAETGAPVVFTSINVDRPLLEVSPFGFEFSFVPNQGVDQVRWRFALRTGSRRVTATVIANAVTDELRYVDSAGAEVVFASGLTLFNPQQAFHTGKLVVNPTAETYVRFVWNNRVYLLTNIATQAIDDATPGQFSADCAYFKTAGINGIIYFDDVIVTQNEPV